MRIAITGGTGFIGSHLVKHFIEHKAEVILISRSLPHNPAVNYLTWQQLDNNPERLEGLDALVNLAGESISQRWTVAAKRKILHSRLSTADRIAQLVEQLKQKPKLVVSASAMAIYGTSESDTYNEQSPPRMVDFLSGVVEEWENAVDKIQGARIVKVRMGLVLGNDGGAFPKMRLPYTLGVGGKVGSGKQWLSWIHIADVVRLIDFCIRHDDITGPVNATAPNPVTNQEFGRTLAKVMFRPNLVPVPAFMLKLIFGELSVLLLEGQRVIPQVLLDHGFEFTYPKLEAALAQLQGITGIQGKVD